MTAAQEIIEDGFALALVDEADIALEADESAIGVRFLNDYCADQFDSGIDFGYRPVSTPDEPVTSPASVNRALKKIMARECAPLFGVPLSPDVLTAANQAESDLRSRYLRITPSRFTVTTPRGSGNSDFSSGDGDKGSGGAFFSTFFRAVAVPQAFLRLDASTTVTIATIDTPAAVTGPWVVDRDVNTTSTTAGAITFDIKGDYLANLEANLTINTAGSDQFTFYFAINGALLEQSRLVFDADRAQNILVKWVGTLRDTDIVTLLVENNSATTNLTLTNGHLRVT